MKKKEKGTLAPTKLRLMLMLCCLMLVASGLKAQSPGTVKLSIRFANVTLDVAMRQVKEASPVNIAYDAGKLRLAQWQVSPKEFKQANLSDILQYLLQQANVGYKEIAGGMVLFEKEKIESAPAKKDKGRMMGKVIDEENGEPVIGATIRVGEMGAVTDDAGGFSLPLSQGKYVVLISSMGYGTKEVSGVAINENETFTLNATLKRKKGNLATVVVKSSVRKETAASLYNRQRTEAGISNGISREQIAALPDKNIGETLKRISGVSTTDNRRVVVRGIAERYNMAMMDGAALPSTDVQVRDFEFDIVPSNLVDNVVVSKTATPDMGFGFGGGMVQINTLAIADNNFTTLSFGSKYINGSTGKEFLGFQRGKSDYLGFDDGGRNHFPKEIMTINTGNYDPQNPYNFIPTPGIEKVTPQMIAAQNKEIGGLERMGTRTYKAAPGQNYQFSLGRSYNLRNSRIGFVGSLSYRNEQAIDDIVHFERGAFNKKNNNLYNPETLEELKESKAQQYNFTTSWGALLNAGWQGKHHRITARNFYSRVFANQFFRISGWGDDLGFGENPALNEYDRPKFIDLLQNRINGEHNFGRLKFDWSVARNEVTNHEQDAVDANLSPLKTLNGFVYNYLPQPGITANPGQLSRSSYRYVETNWMADAALSYRFTVKTLPQVVKAGFQYMDKKGHYDWNVLPIGVAGNFKDAFKPVNQWNIDFANPLTDAFYYPAAFNNNTYTGKNNNQAVYAMMDNRFTPWLRLVWGLRGEYYKYEKIKDEAADKVSQANLDNSDKQRYVDPETGKLVHQTVDASVDDKPWAFLPSGNLTITPFSNFNIRASFAQSAIRPALIENSSFARFNYLYGRIQRNTGVLSTLITHYDLRVEWYPGAGEVISAGYFKKHFKNPVEMYLDITNTSGAVDLLTANSDYADVTGWEVDLRKSLGFIAKGAKFLDNLYFSGNLTIQNSQVQASAFRYGTIGGGADIDGKTYAYRTKTYLKEKRPLYGQVPVLYNIGLQYAGERFGANIAINHSGYKTFTVGMQPHYSELERPRDQVDAQLSYKFLKDKKLNVRLNVSNLTNSPYRFFINGQNTYQIKPATSDMNMNEWSDVYEWKEGFSQKYDAGHYEVAPDGKNKVRVGDTDTFIRKVGASFSLSVSYNF
ncbi:TonB-dependent receptor [Chitinophaga nivalis]|uniref:TonB-dependent receptor n=1 Tax=Chitinophaga nivalis TaxID=2991709 RepID=A0ABT3IEU3_9BACT|nr:TonB-dependent receptor [Chitinophaga nivalis]MCW3467829.1 TonB-dependent receptor [Chitinophaga nivalis]MCW3482479.1 TonB-dependent receptor [Chitinophaga nivalis]